MVDESQQFSKPHLLVVEDDTDIRGYVKDLLEAKGFAVQAVENADEAWPLLRVRQTTFDAVILDWKFGGALSALGLINRIKSLPAYELTPILVVSGYLNQKELRYLKEVVLAEAAPKPVRGEQIHRKLRVLFQEKAWLQKQKQKLSKAMAEIKSDKADAAFQEVMDLMRGAPRASVLHLLAGRIFRQKGHLQLALACFHEALELDPSSPLLMGEVGRVFLQIGKLDDAKRFLHEAHLLSPHDVNRICDLGHIDLQDGQVLSARDYFAAAAAIDETAELVTSSQQMVSDIQAFVAAHQEVPRSYAGLLNAIGIALVRDQEFTKGLHHYQLALRYLSKSVLKAKLAYNLGLGYWRWGKIPEARTWLEMALSFHPDYYKAQQLLAKMGGGLVNISSTRGVDESGEDAVEGLGTLVAFGRAEEEDSIRDDQGRYQKVESGQDRPPTNVAGDASSVPRAGDNESTDADQSSKKAKEERSEAGLPKGGDAVTAQKLSDLAAQVPEVKELLANCIADGLYFPREVVLLKSILDEYGPSVLQQAVHHALNRRMYSASAIVHYVEHTQSKGAG